MSETNSTLTAARLRELLSYDPETGVFVWRVDGGPFVKAGAVAGALTAKGYRRIGIDGKQYKAGRLAWLYVHGVWPTQQIDHKNGDRDGNWIDNLRDVSNAVNSQNQRKARPSNKSGVIGVRTEAGGFAAYVTVNGVDRRLGKFPTVAEASAVRQAAKRELVGAVG
jgi:hypothetical protein